MHLLEVLPLSDLVIAQANGGGPAQSPFGSLMPMLLMVGGFFLFMHFVIQRPERKRQQELEDMRNGLKKGDQVVTIGGIHGSVVGTKDRTVVLRVDDNTTLEFERRSIDHILQTTKEEN